MVHFWTVGNLPVAPWWDSRTLECAWTDAISQSLPIFIFEITPKHWEAASCSGADWLCFESDDCSKHFFDVFFRSSVSTLMCFSVFSRTHTEMINTRHPERPFVIKYRKPVVLVTSEWEGKNFSKLIHAGLFISGLFLQKNSSVASGFQVTTCAFTMLSIHVRHLYAAALIHSLLMPSSVHEENKQHNMAEWMQYLLSAKIFRMCFSHCDINNNNNDTYSA